jgi:DNA-binding HxlR family transcriptional regulator
VAGARSYDDRCGTARALDIIGERWALLIVRDLLFGPKRFGTLRSGLSGVSPNVLSQRLHELEDAGIVRRDRLPPPADVPVYALTARGRALEPVLVELGRWGSAEHIGTDRELGVDAFALALKTTFAGHGSSDATYALHVSGEWFTLAVRDGSLDIARGRPASADVEFTGAVGALRSYAFGRESLDALEAMGSLAVSGSRSAARRFPRLFRVPDRRPVSLLLRVGDDEG